MLPDVKEFGFAVAVGVAVIGSLLWSARKQQTFMQTLVENHLAHSTKAVEALTVAITELNVWLRQQQSPPRQERR